MTALNICIFGTSFLPVVGGKEYVMHHLGNALTELGHDVTLVSKRLSWTQPSHEYAYHLTRYGLPIKGSGKMGLDFVSAIIVVTLLHRRKAFDVINCHGVDYAGIMARYLKSINKIPLVMTPHGQDVQRVVDIGYGLRLDAAWDRRITRNIKSADYVTAISKSIHADLDMVEDSKIIDLPNGIYTSNYAGPKVDYLHKRLDIPKTTRIILSVGRNHVKKGYGYGIEAVSRLVWEMGCKNVHYVIVGRDVTEYEQMATDCRAKDFVTLIDEMPPEKIVQCYKSSDVFFSPSIVEGFSLVSLEAMASGLPLVVTNVPGNEDVVKANGCGIVVENKNTVDMANGLFRLLSDNSYRESLAKIAAQCSKNYDWLEVAAQYEKVYRQAMQNTA